jgi:hypothetical protein
MLGPKGYKGKHLPDSSKPQGPSKQQQARARQAQTGPLNKRAIAMEVRNCVKEV